MITKQSLLKDFLSDHKWWAIGIVTAVVLSNIARVLIPLSIGYFYKINFHSSGGKISILKSLGLHIHTNQQYLVFVIAVILIFSLFYFIQLFGGNRMAELFSFQLKELLFSRQLHGSINTFSNQSVEKSTLRYNSDMKAIQQYISKGIFVLIGDSIYAIMMIGIFTSISAVLAACMIGFYAIMWIVVHKISKVAVGYSSIYYDKRAILLQYVHTQLHMFYSVKSLNRESLSIQGFNRKNKRIYQASYQKIKLEALQDVLIRSSVFISIFMVMAIIVNFEHHVIPKHSILVCILLLLYFQSTVRRIFKVPSIWKKGNEAFSKAIQILELPYDNRVEVWPASEPVKGKIQLEHIQYSYQTNANFSLSVSFIIEPNSITQIKGSAGSGKSTLLKLIQYMWEPNEGTLFLDNIPYHHYSPFEIRKHISIVNKETELIGKTLFELVTYNANEKKKDKVLSWLKKVQFREGEMNENILDEKVQQNENHLSRQDEKLLKYVRTFASGKQVILIDDPFEYLDEAHIITITNLLNTLSKKRTIIIADNHHWPLLLTQKIIQL